MLAGKEEVNIAQINNQAKEMMDTTRRTLADLL